MFSKSLSFFFSVKFWWSPDILRKGPEYVGSTRGPSTLFARSWLVLRAPFALGEILLGFSAAQKRIEVVQKLLLLSFFRFVLKPDFLYTVMAL